MKEPHYSVCLIDDEASVRKSMQRLLGSAGFEIMTFSGAKHYLTHRQHFSQPVGCLLLDMSMPEINGLQLQKQLNTENSATPIIFLTAHAEIELGIKAMKNGALDFLIKPVNQDTLFDAVRKAFKQYHDTYVYRRKYEEAQQRYNELTSREREVLTYIIGGAKNREISSHLNISEKTVKIHRGHIMQKLDVSNPAELGYICAAIGLASSKLAVQ